jgi:CheY-like chemotaxis protein
MSPVFQKDLQPYNLEHIQVLLVEDTPAMQTLISSMLRSFGVREILVCSGAQEAISLLTVTQAQKQTKDIRQVDIILTDWLMPEGSGLDLIDWVRANKSDSIRFLPIILVSAFVSEQVVTAARDHGAHEALVKPISGTKLAQRITSVIDQARPFIKTDDFFGPDRRRKDVIFAGENRRKMNVDLIKVNYERN